MRLAKKKKRFLHLQNVSMFFGGGSECTALSLHLNTTTEVPLIKTPNPQLLPGRRSINVCFHCCVFALRMSDGEVKRSAPVKFSTQLYQKKVHYSKLVKTVHTVAI